MDLIQKVRDLGAELPVGGVTPTKRNFYGDTIFLNILEQQKFCSDFDENCLGYVSKDSKKKNS